MHHSCSLCFCFYPSPLRLKTTAARRHLFVFMCFRCLLFIDFFFPLLKLWRFVKQPEEGSPAVHRGGEGGGGEAALPAVVVSVSQSEIDLSHPTNRMLFDPRALGADPI